MNKLKHLAFSLFLTISFAISYGISQPRILLILPISEKLLSPKLAFSAPLNAETSNIPSPPLDPPKNAKKVASPAEILAYVRAEARKNGINPIVAEFIVRKESEFDPTKKGDGNLSFGLWQIYLPAHPDVTEELALDYEQATAWAMKHLSYEPTIWSTFKYCRLWYQDCPL